MTQWGLAAKLNQTFKPTKNTYSCFQLSQTNEKEKTVKQEDKQNWKHEEAYRRSALGETQDWEQERELKDTLRQIWTYILWESKNLA